MRHKKLFLISGSIILAIVLLVAAFAVWFLLYLPPITHQMPDGEFGIAFSPEPYDIRSKVDVFPEPRAIGYQAWEYGLKSVDMTQLDLTDQAEALSDAAFDTLTQWPDALPEDFDPAAILEMGKDPGLSVRDLHQQGITGKDVSIAIIDQNRLLVEHQEYADSLVHYEELRVYDKHAGMHATATASLAVGNTCGVAPDAKLYYFGCSFVENPIASMLGMRSYRYLVDTLKHILDINAELPEAERIRAVSISIGFDPDGAYYEELQAMIQRTGEQGVAVISVPWVDEVFGGLTRGASADPDRVESYGLTSYYLRAMPYMETSPLFFPMDNRTYASPAGAAEYEYSAHGGDSWICPYIAGLYALALQENPTLAFDAFWQLAVDTAAIAPLPDDDGTLWQIQVVQPQNLIERLTGS